MRVSVLDAWYALRVRSNHERTVARYLDYGGIDAFLPTYSVESRWSDRTKTLDRCLFPGYVFARLADPAIALETAGVCGILGGLRPSVIPDSEIENVRIVCASLLPMSPADFHPGDVVTVRYGALKDVTGIVQRHAKGVRLVVAIEMMGRGVAVELDAAMLAKGKRAAA